MSRRDQIRMSDDELQAFLHEPGQVLNVASIGPRGDIDLVAMWYGFTADGSVGFTTFGKSQKIVNWRRDPRFTGLVETGDRYEELRGAELVGTVELVEDEEEKLVILRSVGERYPQGPAVAGSDPEAGRRRMVSKRIGVKLHVERVITWDHTKLGGVY